MRHRIASSALFLGVLSAFGSVSAQDARAPLVIDRGTVERTLVEPGELVAVRSRDLVAPGDWRAEARIVFLQSEGTTVAAGDTLVRFDTGAIVEQIRQAQAELERRQAAYDAKVSAQAQAMAGLRARVRTAEFAAEQARLQLSRMEFAAEIERQSARLSLRKAELDHDEATKKLGAQAVLDSLELAQARTEIAQARGDLERERQQIDRMVITAPIDGLVIHGESGEDDRKVREGDEIPAGTVVVRLPDLSQLEVQASVHELDRAFVDVGQTVRVGFDAYPDLALPGRVQRVAELAGPARRRSRIQRFEVKIEVDGSDARLRPGMTARVEIVTARRDDVVRVPRAALGRHEGRPAVVTADGTRVEVELGLVTPFFAELLEGPPPGTALRRASDVPALQSFEILSPGAGQS